MPSLLQKGARNAIVDCLAVKPEDRVFIMTDEETLEIGQALYEEAREITPETKMIIWEDYGDRPFKEYPQKIEQEILEYNPTVTIFAASDLEGELQNLRHHLHAFINKHIKSRHAHMIGITRVNMETGMQADYHQVSKRAREVYEFVKNAREIVVTCPDGTDLKATFSHKLKWVNSDGLFTSQAVWANLPNGEVFTTPKSMDGKLVVYLFGDYFDEKYGVLKNPVEVTFKDGRVIAINGKDTALIDELKEYIKADENASRVGEFAIGVNEFIKELTGNLLQDEKFPGVHVAIGDPIGNRTGADWESEIHLDMIPLRVSINADGKVIMKDGKFLI